MLTVTLLMEHAHVDRVGQADSVSKVLVQTLSMVLSVSASALVMARILKCKLIH